MQELLTQLYTTTPPSGPDMVLPILISLLVSYLIPIAILVLLIACLIYLRKIFKLLSDMHQYW